MSGRRVALLVGIVDYIDQELDPLECAYYDIKAMSLALATHRDTTENFEVIEKVIRTEDRWTASLLVSEIESALKGASHFLFYFSGHAVPSKYGLQLATPEKESNFDSGVYVDAILHRINGCDAEEVTIILDCCHAGAAGDSGLAEAFRWTQLREGVTVLASSEAGEVSYSFGENPSRFTTKLVERLHSSESATVTVLDLFTFASDIDLQTPVLRTFGSNFSPLRTDTASTAQSFAAKRARARESA